MNEEDLLKKLNRFKEIVDEADCIRKKLNSLLVECGGSMYDEQRPSSIKSMANDEVNRIRIDLAKIRGE